MQEESAWITPVERTTLPFGHTCRLDSAQHKEQQETHACPHIRAQVS